MSIGHGFKSGETAEGVRYAACTCGWETVHGHYGDPAYVAVAVKRDWDEHCAAGPVDRFDRGTVQLRIGGRRRVYAARRATRGLVEALRPGAEGGWEWRRLTATQSARVEWTPLVLTEVTR